MAPPPEAEPWRPPPGRQGSATRRSCHVAVIGAGAAGLVAARELLREGHQVAVLEASHRMGGVWAYDERTEADPLGAGEPLPQEAVHSSMYYNLRTNLPREIMAFTDFPFVTPSAFEAHAAAARDAAGGGEAFPLEDYGDGRRYPHHAAVQGYLEDFARTYELLPHVRFRARVADMRPEPSGGVPGGGGRPWTKWRVSTQRAVGAPLQAEVFDAVVVCNGHYSRPKAAEIPGADKWPGRQMHSHNYRHPEPFKDMVVVVVGAASSGDDIAREVAACAREVHLCARWTPATMPAGPMNRRANLWPHPLIVRAHESGGVEFGDGATVRADVIIHCTGYRYSCPFLRGAEAFLSVGPAFVGSLYEHVFPPAVAPTLSFVGLPWKVVPFPLCELQSKWVAMALSGAVALPPPADMLAAAARFRTELDAAGVPERHVHNLDKYQFPYVDSLATTCHYPPLEPWREAMYEAGRRNRAGRPEDYRDLWVDDDLIEQAVASQAKLLRQLQGKQLQTVVRGPRAAPPRASPDSGCNAK